MITLYNSDAITEICILDNCLECLVTEEENGVFELELTYSISSNNFTDIQNNKVIKAKASDELGEQLFRIYYVSNEIDGKIYVKAQHITYDLIDNFVENITCTNSTCQNSFQTMLSKCQHSHKFKGYSDIEHIGTYNLSRVNALEAILGTKGSLLDTYGNGAKLKRDNYNIYLNKTRGSNNGVTISYSKNITGYKREIDETGVITCIYPFAKFQKELGEGDTVEETIVLPERFVNSKYINNYPHPKILAVDYSEKEIKDIASLRTQANKYFQETQKDIPNVNYKIEFIYLHQTVEYEDNNLKALELVGMGDTVTVVDERIGMNVEANVIKTVFNVLTDRYESIELGRFKSSINDIIGDLESSVDNALTQVNNMYVNFEVLDDKIISEVSKLEGDIKANSTLIEQTDSYIQSTVTDLNGKYTSIKQTVDNIDLTGKVSFSDLSTKGATVINGANITTGSITADQLSANSVTSSELAANSVTSDHIVAGSLSVDELNSNNSNPIIKLFGNCALDATQRYGQGQGSSIRLKWNDSDYLKVGSDTFEFYNSSAGESPCLKVYGGTGTTYLVTPTKTLMINSTGLHVDGAAVSLTTHSHNGTYAPYSHDHSGETLKPDTLQCRAIGGGSYPSILMHSSLDGNSKNLGYSGSKFNQVSAYAVWGDTGSWSDVKTKENIRYLDDEARVISENDISSKLELFEFIKSIKICEYNYKEEFKFDDKTNNKIGFVADDVVGDKIGDKIVAEHEGYLTYNTNNMLFATIGALQYEIEKRNTQIKDLELENQKLNNRLSEIEKILETINS